MLHHYRTTPLILVILLLSTLVIKISTWAQGHGWEHHGWTGGISVVSVVGGFLALHDRLLWRFPVFNWLVNVPVVRGEYTGTIRYVYDGEERAKDVQAVVKQRATSISVQCSFRAIGDARQEDTRSRSTHADLFDTDGHGSWQLCMQYRNEGERVTGTTTAHDGIAVLDLDLATGALKGHYYTNRKTMGSMELRPVQNQ
ncbi:MAG: hypothetical protein JNL05_00590 [Flavobacteriales bacterium]|nr:hypothetical protein [Flavobacteriales bacterium]